MLTDFRKTELQTCLQASFSIHTSIAVTYGSSNPKSTIRRLDQSTKSTSAHQVLPMALAGTRCLIDKHSRRYSRVTASSSPLDPPFSSTVRIAKIALLIYNSNKLNPRSHVLMCRRRSDDPGAIRACKPCICMPFNIIIIIKTL